MSLKKYVLFYICSYLFPSNYIFKFGTKNEVLYQCAEKRALNYCYRAFLTKVTLPHMKLTNDAEKVMLKK